MRVEPSGIYSARRANNGNRNMKSEFAWARRQNIYSVFDEKDKPRRKVLPEIWAETIQSDALTYADDLTNKTTGAHEIGPEITAIGKYGHSHDIDINWGEIKII